MIWTSTVTTGDVEWIYAYRAVGGDDNQSLDQATAQESVNVNDTAPTAINNRMVTSIPLTNTNFAADDTVLWDLFRDGTDAGNTLNAAVTVHDILFEYTT